LGESTSIEQRGVVSPHIPRNLPSSENENSGWSGVFVWTAFLVAFSPIFFDVAEHARQQPWAAWSLVFALLLAVLARRDFSREERNRAGYVLLGLALLLEAFAIVGGPMRWGRLAIPLGVFGLARILGRPSQGVAALACWTVPVPWAIVSRGSPLLEYIWLRLAAATLSSFAPISVHRGSAAWPGGTLSLDPSDGGLPLMALLSGVGWIYSLQGGCGLSRSLRTVAVWGHAGRPMQMVAVLIALALAVGGKAEAARAWLSWGIFAVWAILALTMTLRVLRASHHSSGGVRQARLDA